MKITQFLSILLAINLCDLVGSDQGILERNKRFITFPPDSATGILVALAIPLELRNRAVFVSYNFEANYGMPEEADDYIPGPLERLEITDRGSGRKNEDNSVLIESDNETLSTMKEKSSDSTIEKRSTQGSLFTRKKIYRTLEHYLQCHGHRGKVCLLRTICEAAENPFYEHNGLIGDIVHVILTPSTSVQEDLHPEYYKAEELGRSGDCSKYKKHCPECILNYISEIFEK